MRAGACGSCGGSSTTTAEVGGEAYYEKEDEMPMFKVTLDATVEVEVEAENAEQAREKALAEAEEFDSIQSRGLSILPTVLSVVNTETGEEVIG